MVVVKTKEKMFRFEKYKVPAIKWKLVKLKMNTTTDLQHTCDHDGSNVGFPQCVDDRRRLRLQLIFHDQQPQEVQVNLHLLPGGQGDFEDTGLQSSV